MKVKNILTLLSLFTILGCSSNIKPLPTPEIETGMRGDQFGIDKNINEKTIDNYLNRDDVCYRDVRMLKDPANYEAIGGDSYLSGFIKGFEVVPYPFLAPTSNLPTQVGTGYTGDTLFTSIDNRFIPNYEESMDILEYFFPKDLNIFLMCGGGGYAFMTKNLLISLGWDENKIYNVGGYWYYEGNNKIEIKRVKENNEIVYDFYKVNYHEIDFSILTEIK